MESGPQSTGGRAFKPTSAPQSGVFSSSVGGGLDGRLADGVPLQLVQLPLAGDMMVRVRCDGILTLRGRPHGSDPVQELLGGRCFSHTVLMSLEKVVGAETSGVSWLYQTGGRFTAAGGRLFLYAVPATVLSLFELLEMTLPFAVVGTEVEARALAGGRAE